MWALPWDGRPHTNVRFTNSPGDLCPLRLASRGKVTAFQLGIKVAQRGSREGNHNRSRMVFGPGHERLRKEGNCEQAAIECIECGYRSRHGSYVYGRHWV